MLKTFKLKKSIVILSALFIALFTTSCQKEEPGPTPSGDAFTVAIDPTVQYQTIAGFGGANRMWGTQFLKPAEAEKAFSTEGDGLGLSIFRVRIASNETEWPLILEAVQEAQKHGVKIQASPWSPPAALKSNGSDIGGYLPEENYVAFKDHINAFVQYMADNGVDIHAVSIQNEPDIQVSYESCDWSPNDMANFLKNYGSQIQGTQVAAPESFNFNPSFTNALLNDPEAEDDFDIVAGHIYGGGLADFPLAEQKGKEIWMTEYLLNLNTGNAGASPWTSYSDATKWEESLTMLNTIHEAMSHNWNAYIWWYIQRYYSFIGDGEEGTIDGEILKRGEAFAHFSRYIRPGFVRVQTAISREHSLDITAYQNSDQIIVVIINPTTTAVGNVNFTVPSLSAAKGYTTSELFSWQERPVEIQSDRVIMGILPKSVTTIVIDQ